MTADDMGLVQEYARSNSEEAFSMIVSRHINLVYSVALRQVGDAHQAEEITQVVFILLARKAGALSPKTILSGWLCRTARNVSARALTMKGRRERREQEAYMQSIMNEPEAEAWSQITPLLDGALEQLGGKDHDAIVLRFFEGKSFKDVGLVLGASEDTAKKRVSRTLEKLRRFFLKRGVVLSTAIIAGAVTANSVKAAPAALAKSVTAAAISNGAAATGSTLLLIKGALKAMAWTKLKIAAVAGVAVLLTAGTATVVINRVVQAREDAIWGPLTQMVKELEKSNGNYLPPSAVRQMRSLPKTSAIRPTGFADIRDGWGQTPELTLGLAVPASGVFGHAYDISRTHIVNPELLPRGSYDFVVTTPGNRLETLQRDLKRKFGLAGRRVTIETNVMVLTVSRPGAAGLQHVKGDEAGKTLSSFIFNLEHGLKIPVVDRTGLKGRYNLAVDWDQTGQGNPDAVNLVLLQQFGLELKPDVEPIEMLLLEKAR